ncbi:TetR/AcrR family transcriptional regulator [Novosphingobium album (ex Hu et al. 2023)]|uniref:TetR/AcrR family transcriptional regulator n=1 Tax=Novosphingobium album (ex Hu et al. 2023) TaxID=2930093 RepID=UPI001FBAC03E|nr:helix-turn-helix domain-containing protein [Novosphingobium album (ex Hu et al. 2023)]
MAQEFAQTEAQGWCDAQLRQISDFPGQRSAFAGFFSELVDGWSCGQRRLAFSWREAQVLATTGDMLTDVAGGWEGLWSGFWQEAGRAFSLGCESIVAARVFENESLLHMLHWRRIVDRAGLAEFGQGLGAWLTGTPMPAAPWREFAREQAMRSVPALPARDAVAMAIVAAAGELIGRGGVAHLTHRAVAQRAGVTLGVVLHRFRTKAQLVEAAFEAIYLSLVSGGEIRPTGADAPLPVADMDEMAGLIIRTPAERGLQELFLAAARDPSLIQFGAQFRYTRGRKSWGTVQAIAGSGREVGNLEAALFSSFASSLARACGTTEGEAARREIQRELQVVADLIANGDSGTCRVS